MKASSARYLVGQGMKSIWRNRMMSFASFCIILVSLLMVGMSVLVTINLNRIISGIEDQSEAAVTIKDDIGEDRQKALQKEIEALSNVATVEFYSKDEAWKNMKKDMSDEQQDLFRYADDNPLPDTFRVTVKDISLMADTSVQIELLDDVDSVKSPTQFADVLVSIKNILMIIMTCVIAALIVVCLIIISNTTRASVFARRKEINIMKYVGATNTFIRIPFFIEGMVVGIFAAGAALLLTKFAYEGVYNIFKNDMSLWSILGIDNLYPFAKMFVKVTASYIIAGAVIGALGTSISASKHLKV
ncbi:cell division transport system permease protein [Ruminococcus sp. YE71]|uniref:permease-like cell division protein FtsX n=1 Tax=unclassified Ruminococcus TaxID=2608920 RepID=UPI0008808ADB|nr:MULTISPECIES: permease-like cell division protein FtsX [unclassified Ruminococcus]SDA27662.1 cell division transport system permease protein [Ruminococcus sp. YE78]SFW45867.1 cell division transport system permease protein [Ruminococcus sp. YE71]